MTDDLSAVLASRVLVLDGGLGTLLEARGNDLTSALWSAALLRDRPDEVRAAHAEFAAAGADVLTTSTYQLAFGGAIDDSEVERLLRLGVSVARDAGDGLVAASVGPFGASRADGSEYTGDDGLSVDQLRRWHRRRLHVLADAGADLLAIETIPSLREVEALVSELDALDVDAWVSLSASSTAFASAGSSAAGSSTTMAAAFEIAAASPRVRAVGVNCCPPADVSPALAAAPATPLIAYPNSGETWDAEGRRWEGRPGISWRLAEEWMAAGARLVGGCCRTTPAHIAELARAVHAA